MIWSDASFATPGARSSRERTAPQLLVYADDLVYVDADGDAVVYSLLVPLPLVMINIARAYNAVNRAALTGTLGVAQTSMDELD